jgi:hypothetical protein
LILINPAFRRVLPRFSVGDGNVHERIACLPADGVPLYAGRHVERSSELK